LENIPLSIEVAFFLASNIDSNIRVLEGSLIRIGAFASLTKISIDIQTAKEVLKSIIKPKEELISIDLIQKVVSTFFNVKVSDLKAKRKYKGYVLPRQVGMYLSRKMTDASLLEIGDKFGGKDHSTVLHSIKKVEEKMSNDPSFKETIENLHGRIKS
jgi:chromosomal replication initiator protein